MQHLLAKYGKITPLREAERNTLEGMVKTKTPYRRGRTLIAADHDQPDQMYIVSSGQLYASAILPNGLEAITRLYFPGDIIGTVNMPFEKATQTVTVSRDAQLYVFPRANLIAAFLALPRIAAIFYTFTALENAILSDRLVSLGRTKGLVRLASLIMEVVSRRNLTLDHPDYTIDLQLTQEQIGQAIGLTSIQVNRLLRELEGLGVINRAGKLIEIRDVQKLKSAGSFRDRYSDLDLDWFDEAAFPRSEFSKRPSISASPRSP